MSVLSHIPLKSDQVDVALDLRQLTWVWHRIWTELPVKVSDLDR